MFRWEKTVILSMIALLFLSVTAAYASPQVEGGAVGGIIGGVAGALLDHKNPWRGGVIGAGLGAVAGATITDISVRGSQEAAQNGRPVEYRTENGGGVYHAEPVGDVYYPDERTTCRKIHERIWEHGRLVKDTTREVCEGERTEQGYGDAAYAAPPEYAMPDPPSMVVVPGTYVYAVPDAPSDILFYRGYWWHPYRGQWYRADHWNGPWCHVRRGWVPRAVVEIPPDYPRRLYGRDRIAYRDLRDNWGRWERDKHWDRHEGRHEGWREKHRDRREEREGDED